MFVKSIVSSMITQLRSSCTKRRNPAKSSEAKFEPSTFCTIHAFLTAFCMANLVYCFTASIWLLRWHPGLSPSTHTSQAKTDEQSIDCAFTSRRTQRNGSIVVWRCVGIQSFSVPIENWTIIHSHLFIVIIFHSVRHFPYPGIANCFCCHISKRQCIHQHSTWSWSDTLTLLSTPRCEIEIPRWFQVI